MQRDELYSVLFEQQKEFARNEMFVQRETTESLLSSLKLKIPFIITGVRRAGKSTLLKIIKNTLNLTEKEFFYINFNDERLISFKVEDFQKILDFIEEEKYKQNCSLFVDEIQEVEKWEKWIDRIKDNHLCFITGSNSKLLSKEISTVLTGRSLSISLYPFSFREFLHFKKILVDKVDKDLKVQARLRKELTLFLELGGIPKVVTENEPRLLSELYENIIYRDIVKRFNPNLEKPIKEMSLLLLSSSGKKVSLRSLSTTLSIKNISSVKSIVDTFEKAFLFFFVPKFDFSLRKQIQNPQKVYCVDTGFITQVGFRFSDDKGRILENMVFIELKRQKKEIYYFSGKGECDFILKEGVKPIAAIQVCYNLTIENKEREIEGLIEALENFNLKDGLILTFDQEDQFQIRGRKINVLPAWKWLV